ncbi:MAG: helix-turn-helix transcriptional regulator [Vicinamibacteria bacterium]|jgi:AraC-like DNA-binding protein|nr:helix-turn-helix transcriptional regulator [Vicinamibacteria bacterium]
MRSAHWTDATRASAREAEPLDRIAFRGGAVTIGAFRCAPDDPRFADSGPIQNHIFVFPRQTVRLRHEGEAAFVAGPGVVTLYNRGQRYSRGAVSPRGDECEWFAVDDALLVEAVAAFDPAVRERPQRPFRHAWTPGDARLYLAQRALYERLAAGAPGDWDALEVEEAVLHLLAGVLARGHAFWQSRPRDTTVGTRAREIVAAAEVVLARRFAERLTLHEIARAAGCSPFHLCRAFRAATGTTLHVYRNRLRLQHALERVAAGADLSQLALELGYSSHSHFTAAFRRLFGVAPSVARARLRPAGRFSAPRRPARA